MLTPENLAQFAVGNIMVCKWGHEQTNVDFYKIVKVTNTKPDVLWVTLQEIETKQEHNGQTMTGTAMPNPDKLMVANPGEGPVPPFRRRIFLDNGVAKGCKIKDYSYAYPWDGTPQHYSTYG